MSTKIYELKNNKTGSAMVFVVILFFIMMIIFAGINFVFSSNLKMSVTQAENLRAHYLTLSGIDITKSTLLSTLYVENGVEKTMLDKIRADNISFLEDIVTIDGEVVDIDVSYDNVADKIIIESTVNLKSGITKHMTLELKFSGNQYRERWSK